MVEEEESEVGRGSLARSQTSIEMVERSDRKSTHEKTSRKKSSATTTAVSSEEDDDEMELKYGAEHVIRLFVPVSICMAAVVLTMKTLEFFSSDVKQNDLNAYTPFYSTSEDDTTTRVLSALGNAAIIIGFVVVMTFALVLLYKFKCYKVLHGWMFMSSALLLTFFAGIYVFLMIQHNNWCISQPTVFLGMFNYAVMGIICIHWKGPLLLQQAYLISISALMALMVIKMLPDWTAYAVLVFISIWDLIAVLCPKGPLNMLVKMSQERNEPIFAALIYSSGILLPYTTMMSKLSESSKSTVDEKVEESTEGREKASNGVPSAEHRKISRAGGDAGTASRRESEPPTPDSEDEEESGVKLGLGDFVFYSVLIGIAVKHSADWNTLVACYLAILMGLCATLILLAVFKKALPALPISITAGLIMYFSTSFLITPFASKLMIHQLTY